MADRLERLVEERVGALGVDVEEVALSQSGSKRVLKVAIDADGGVSIDTITDVTRDLSAALDESDVMGKQPYTLEVTSRGLDRPLTHPRHWRRNHGRLVSITLLDGPAVSGRIVGSDEVGVDVAVKGQERRVAYADVSTARITPELRPRPGAEES